MRFPSEIHCLAIAALIFFLVGMAVGQRVPPRPAPPAGRPAMAPPSLVQIRAEIKDLLAAQPHEVFVRLNTFALAIATVERVEFARQAVARLAGRIEVSNNPWTTLLEIRTANQNAELFDSAIHEGLGVLVRLAERRALADAVFEVRHLAERGRWGDVVRRGQEWRKRLHGLDHTGLDPQALKTRSEVQEALTGITRIGLQRAALDALQEGLRTGKLDKVVVTNLPPRLSDSVRGLLGLQVVRELAAESRLEAREIAALKENLACFTKSLRTLPNGDGSLGTRILQDLAVRHFLQGHTAEYRALMPADGSAEHAAELLHDLKALALGKGKGATPLAEAAQAGDPPPGMRALLSEGARKNWRPPARGAAPSERPALEKAVEASQALKVRIETDLKTERRTEQDRANEARQLLETAQRHLREQEEADGNRFTEVETALGRPLDTMEKVRVRQLAARQQTAPQIVAALKQQAEAKATRH